MPSQQALNGLAAGLLGPLVQRTDADYDEARALYNAMIDKRPLLIARCADVADVITSVNFARDNAMLVALRGGGHNGPGLGSCDEDSSPKGPSELSLMHPYPIDGAVHRVGSGGGAWMHAPT